MNNRVTSVSPSLLCCSRCLRACPTDATARRRKLAFALELKRDLHLGPIGFDFPVLQHHVLFNDLRDAKVAQSFGRPVDGSLCGLLPRFRAAADQFDDLVDGLQACSPPCGFSVRQVISEASDDTGQSVSHLRMRPNGQGKTVHCNFCDP